MKTLNDLTVPRQPVRKLLERDVQKQCVDWARARGYWARKFSSMTQNSVPDYLFARRVSFHWDSGHTSHQDIKFAVEFKALGKRSTEAQRDEQEAMNEAGWSVYECDNFEHFKEIILIEEAAA